jgi:hypothetical protein
VTVVGVIGNPRSHAYRPLASDGAGGWPGVLLAEPDSPAALLEALGGFHRAGVGLLVVHGGDGTLRHVLSALPGAYPGAPPLVALMRAGNTNLAAWSLGGIGAGRGALRHLLAAGAAGRLRRRTCPVLEIAWVGQPERPPVRGLFMGAAAFAEGKRIADAEIHGRGVYLRHAVGLTLGLTFLRSLAGRGVLRRGTAMAVGIDGGAPRAGPRFLFLATTLGRLTLGLWPFWGGGAGGISWLDIDAPPPRLVRAVLATILRRPAPWMGERGYRSGRASRVALPAMGAFVLDGEFFDPGPLGVTLSCAGTITFVRP